MKLYLVQHGEATSEADDPQRPLTNAGSEDVRRVARFAVERGSVAVERILHSGKTRAQQTAEIWGKELGTPIDVVDGLSPLDDPAIWGERIVAESTDLMLVGHLPHLSKLAGLLVAGDADRAIVSVVPGGLVGLERGTAGWIVWLVTPPSAV